MERSMGKDLNGRELGKGISQRPDGSYMARFVDQYKKRHTFYDRDLKALRRKFEKEKYELEHGLYGDCSDITVSEWFEEFLKLYKVGKVKETTLYRMKQTFSPCEKNVLGSIKLKDIKAVHIQELINKLHASGYSYGTLNLLKSLLGEMFKRAMGNGYMLRNPCDSVVLPKKVKYEPRYLAGWEQEMFLDAAKNYYHYDIFCANLSFGVRIGEALGLKWEDVDFEKKTIHIQRTLHYGKLEEDDNCHFFFTSPKTETSDRIIPLLPETEAVLKRVRKRQLTNRMYYASRWKQEEPFVNLVFTTQQGAPVRYGDVNRTIKQAVVKANLQEEQLAKLEDREPHFLKEFSPHCFRHTFVTRCKMNGIDYETIQLYVGHSDKKMTAYYDHNEPEMDVARLSKVSFLNVV